MPKKQIYVVVAVLILVAGLIAVVYISSLETKASGTLETINCAGAKLGFTYNTSNINASTGTNTFGVIYVTSTGNVTQDISLSVSSHPSLDILVAPSFTSSPGQKSYTEYEVSYPQSAGDYAANVTLTSKYYNCVLSKSFMIVINVANKTVNSSNNSSK